MTFKLLHEHDGLRTFVLVFDAGDDAVEGLLRFAGGQGVDGAQLTAIGAFSRATVGYFDWEQKDYRRIPFDEQLEVLTLAGNLGLKPAGDEPREQGTLASTTLQPALHAHVVLGRRDGSACGGHLLEATVRPTLEVIVIETPRHLQRRLDSETGLALIDPNL